MNTFLGIDYGDSKIGIALSSGNVAVPLKIISNDDQVINNIQDIIIIEHISQIILGLPVNSTGESTDATASVLAFKEKLQKVISVPIIEFDERLSSRQAQAMGAGNNDDAHAAALVLQAYIDSQFND